MASTFLALTNKLLRRLNEVEIAQSDFASVRGVQALAKDAIIASIASINTQEFTWPFNNSLYTQTLTAGVETYAFAATVKAVDWNSFHLVNDDSLGTNGRPLRLISREQRNKYFKNDDDLADTDGRNAPEFVYPNYSFGFGVTPSPDEAYSVTFEYEILPTTLSAYNDTSTIPELFDEVIIQGGIYHMYMFRDNTEQAQVSETKFKNQIKDMRKILINYNYDRITSTQIVHQRPSVMRASNDYFNT